MNSDDDELVSRKWRIALILIGIASLGGGLLFWFVEAATLAISYSHWSNPTPEFKAAADAKMILALMLVVFGVACLFCRRAKRLVIVNALLAALIINAGIAVWLDDLSDRSLQDGDAIMVAPTAPPPMSPHPDGR